MRHTLPHIRPGAGFRIRPRPGTHGQRAVLAVSGSLALVLATTPAATSPQPAVADAAACALPAPAPETGAPLTTGPDALTEAIVPAPPPASSGSGTGGTGAAEGGPPAPGFAPTTGTVTALTVFIDFPGDEAPLTTHERFAQFFPATSEYFADSSFGRLEYQAVPVHRWLRMSQPFERYGIERGSGWDPSDPQGYNRLMREIADALAGEVDFSDYDLVNVLATPQAGPPATEEVLSVTFPGRPLVPTPSGPLRNVSFIWSHQPGESPYRVLVHENGHAFGLPDLYWTGPGTPPPLTGHWDVMEQDWGPTNDLLAWHKWKLGWLTPGQVACLAGPGTTELVLTPAGEPGAGTKLAVVRTGEHTALALEVRAPGGLDGVVCRPGVLVSRIDAAVPSGAGPVRVDDATPGSPGCQAVPDPQVTAPLTDAPYVPGQTFRDEQAGVTAEVLGVTADGGYRVRVTADGTAA
ncbi:M6 family metalloprotease domain-containing protein [Streptomyces sp. 7-21]|uniref:M6 family metalloprotease domain-containing protein n=1 Tax=Streptomyces sp. 7-21 TaxID=2802283 RepID=UPI00191EE28D|nr:M6 family metalloprotease domain-containing protein [Streptomyces sp. 7-21]MBL1067424.1 M6 family metalloprotease domain-containing protein [Streptomyces sp. 7-21]